MGERGRGESGREGGKGWEGKEREGRREREGERGKEGESHTHDQLNQHPPDHYPLQVISSMFTFNPKTVKINFC